MKPSKTVIVHPYGGLGNRIRLIAPSIELAQTHDLSIILIWEHNRFLNCSYDLLFERHPKIRKIVPLPFPEGLSKLIGKVGAATGYPYIGDKLIRSGKFDPDRFSPMLLPTYIHSCYLFGDPSSDIRTYFLPTPAISQKVKSFLSQTGSLIGLHIRRGDNANSSAYSPVDLFVNTIKAELEEDPDTRFFLASDSSVVEQELIRSFGKERILHRQKVLNRGAKNGIIDAWIDLLLLSRCKKIYGSFYSSFSEIAARVGNTPLIVLRK
jgi:hypothetical protein